MRLGHNGLKQKKRRVPYPKLNRHALPREVLGGALIGAVYARCRLLAARARNVGAAGAYFQNNDLAAEVNAF